MKISVIFPKTLLSYSALTCRHIPYERTLFNAIFRRVQHNVVVSTKVDLDY